MDSLKDLATQLSGGKGLPGSFGSFDGREQACLDFVRKNAEQNSVSSVVQAVDRFCYENKWMMNVGDVKGRILQDSIRRLQPVRVLELGTYVGYSSLKMIEVLPPNAKIVTIEISGRAAAIAQQMFEYAGVSSRIQIVKGHLGDKDGSTVKRLESEAGLKPGSIDFVFIDHAKEAYLADLKVIISNGWLRKGGVAFADNVLFPGAPDYLEFMHQNEGTIFSTKEMKTFVEYQTQIPDLVLESTFLGGGRESAKI